jgi:hypothetical protein
MDMLYTILTYIYLMGGSATAVFFAVLTWQEFANTNTRPSMNVIMAAIVTTVMAFILWPLYWFAFLGETYD